MKKSGNEKTTKAIAARLAVLFITLAMLFTSMPFGLLTYANEAEDTQATTEQSTDAASQTQTQTEPKDKAAETPKEEPKKETSKNDSKETAKKETTAATKLSAKANGVTVKLSADAGVFPEGATLSVNTISKTEQKKVDAAIDAEKKDEQKVAASYTFDIKVLDTNGKEVQPADGKSVNLSFTTDEVADNNLSTRVFHVDEEKNKLNATELSVSTKGSTATVETDGFSYYTVEFTYGDKQFVLEGDGVVKLDDLLKSIGIEGEVKGTKVSNSELFDVIRGTKDGVKYLTVFEKGKTKKVPANNPDGKDRYVVSYKPFQTEEWLDVTMTDGTTYHIVVTDAITGNGTNNDPIEGVSQGVGENFAETIPVADVWIDEQIINRSVQARMVDGQKLKWVPGELMDPDSDKYDKGFQVDDTGSLTEKGVAQYYGNHFIIYDTNKKALDGSKETTKKSDQSTAYQSYNYFEGEVGTYIWENAAIRAFPDGSEEPLDVWITYSNPMITLETETNATEAPSWTGVKVGLFGPNIMTNGKDVDNGMRYALDIEVKPTVRDKQGNIVDGYFFYPMVHLNVDRTTNANGNPMKSFQKFYQGNPDLNNYNERMHNYSEQVWLTDGLVANQSGDVIHIPGGSGDQMNYIPNILKEGGTYLVYPSPRNNDLAQNGENVILPDGTEVKPGDSFYFGFLSLVDNGEFKLRYNSSSGSARAGMETYILSGTPFNYRLRHSTETLPSGLHPDPQPTDGGTIQTTRYGNHNGLLNEGERINPSIIATSSGQTVVYTFYPNSGYGIRELWVWNDTDKTVHTLPTPQEMKDGAARRIRQGDGTNDTFVAHDDDNDGIPDRYTYEFSAIHADNAIHVVWGQTILEVTKNTTGSGGGDEDTFQFKIKAWTDDTSVTTPNPIDFTDSSDPEMNKRFKAMEDGWYSFELTNGETLSVPPELIPVGYKWTVEEIGYEVGGKTQWGKSYNDWKLVSDESISGEFISEETQYVHFTNNRKKAITGEKLTVKKVWKDDEKSIRPKNITMTIEKPGAIGVDSQEFGQAIRDLGNAKTVESIKYGTAVEYNTAKSTGKNIIEVEAESGRGEGKVFFWRDGNDVYFYSESEIYLLNSAAALFGDKENQGQDVYNFAALKDISGLEYVHTEFVDDMSNMFLNCYSLQDLSPLENWNTANVTNMAKMFGATSPNRAGNYYMTYNNIEYLENWQTQNVTDMRWMFKGAKALSDLTYLSGWDTGRVQRMEQMFFRTSAGVSANKSALENWNVQSVINSPDNRFKEMFGNSVNQGQSHPDPSVLPNWTNAEKPRAGYWNTAGTYNPYEGPGDMPKEYGKNDELVFFDHPHKDQMSLKSHDVDDSDPTGNTWIYEFKIPAGTTWDVYETLPKNVDDYYLVSTSYDNGKTGEEKETSGPHDGVGKKIEPFKGAQSGSITTITNTGKKHELTIHKDIPENENIEDIPDEDKTFTFTLIFTLGGKPYDIDETDQYRILNDAGKIEKTEAGVYKLKIIGRSSEEFVLPAGVEYNVEETDFDGWTLLGSNHTHGTMNQDRKASFINSKSDTVNVIKKWEGDRYNDAVFPTRPTELDSLGIKITTLDTMTRWKTAGAETHVYSGDSYFNAIKEKYNEQNIDPEVMAADGETPYTPTMEHPKYVKLDTAIGPFDAGDYVIDKVNETHYRVMPVTNVPVTRTYTDLAYGEEWDEDDDWLYEYDIPKTEKVIKVEETQVPDYYQETLPVIEDDGTVTFNIINTLETKNLRIEKETMGDEAGEFEFGIKFWVDNSTEKRHPVKIGHSQILTKNNEGEEITEAEFTFENGITIGGKDVAGVFELIDGEISGQNLHPGGTKPTMEQLDAIISALRTIEEGAADDDFPQHKKTNKTLSHFGLKWNGQDTEIVYVDQDSTVVENLFTNGRRLDWYIIPTPGHDEVITIRTPYALRTADTDDGAKQLPDGVRGNEDTGTYYFKIPNDGHITFPNLPAGVSYDIVEYKYHDWDLINTEGEVTGQLLEEDDTRRVKFTNEKKKGAVKIAKKTMYNTPGTFKFLVKMWEGEGDRIKYMDLSSQGATPLIGQDGLFEFTLDNGKEKTFEDIPYGYSYEVWEDGQDGWELVSVDDNEDTTKAKGVVNGETAKHTFKNKGPIIYPTEEKKVTRTIHFTYEKKNGKQVTGKVVQEVTISRKALELDPETGEVTKWGPWSSATFPAVKNPDKEAGPGWATKDVAPALTINGPVEVKDVYIIYHRTDGSGGADTGDRNNVAIWIAIMAVAVVIALAVIIRRRRNNQ